jgi:uncharacterized protein
MAYIVCVGADLKGRPSQLRPYNSGAAIRVRMDSLQKGKTTVAHLTRAVSALFVLALAVPALAQTPSTPMEPAVVVSGQGIVQAVPDRAWITITAESRASNPRDAQKRNADAMNPVLDKLKGRVAADAIKTIGYDLQQEWDFVNNRRVSRGYVARNTVDVRVDQIDRVGELLEMAVGSGATSVGGIRFDLKNRAGLERDALRLAVIDAKAKAEAAASGAGRVVDRILRIDEQGGIAPPMPVRMMRMEAAQANDAAAPPISAGEMEIRANVTLTASLK